MKKAITPAKRSKLSINSIAIFTLLAVCAFLIYQNHQLTKSINSVYVPMGISCPPKESPINAAGRKTHTNNTFRFSFDYPKTLEASEFVSNNTDGIVIEVDLQQQETSDIKQVIQLTKGDPYQVIDQIVYKDDRRKITKEKIDGIEITKITGFGGEAGAYDQKVILFTKNKLSLIFVNPSDNALVGQILSTLKFTN